MRAHTHRHVSYCLKPVLPGRLLWPAGGGEACDWAGGELSVSFFIYVYCDPYYPYYI